MFLKKSHLEKIGKPPGSLDHVGPALVIEPKIIYRKYSPDNFFEDEINNLQEYVPDSNHVNWLNIDAFNKPELFKDSQKQLGLHSMLLEDILNTEHISKFEELDDGFMLILKSFYRNDNEEVKPNQNVLVLKNNQVFSLQTKSDQILLPKINRMKAGKGKARRKGADYLFFVLLDAFVDTYFIAFNKTDEHLQELENQLLSNQNQNLMEELFLIKRQVTEYRKFLFPLRDSFNHLMKEATDWIKEENLIYYHDIKDHINQLVEYYSYFNETIRSLVDLNEANINHNINKVMKSLTLVASIFIPLTFIAGIYGMNFKFMPELEWDYGYFTILLLMLFIGAGLYVYMKKKKWF